jgi:hypothetical protein
LTSSLLLARGPNDSSRLYNPSSLDTPETLLAPVRPSDLLHAEYLHEVSPPDNIWVNFLRSGQEYFGHVQADIFAHTFADDAAATVGK